MLKKIMVILFVNFLTLPNNLKLNSPGIFYLMSYSDRNVLIIV